MSKARDDPEYLFWLAIWRAVTALAAAIKRYKLGDKEPARGE